MRRLIVVYAVLTIVALVGAWYAWSLFFALLAHYGPFQ